MQEKGQENTKRDRKNGKRKWIIIAACAFTAAILLIGFIAGTWWMEKKAEQEYHAMQEKNAEKRQEVPEQEEKKVDIPVDFDSLQKENPDIYAWITIPDTVIDYPIVQSSEDNSYYLDHSAQKTESVNGAIYSENYNKKDFDDPITLLYGHNMTKRTAVQEQIILPLRAQNYATLVPGKKSERTVFTMAKFTIPDDKCLVVELNEKNGGRHQSFVIENEDLVRANTINELQVR